ncbi:MAG TPA: tRNA (guanine-N1)-methyltransferase, partial [Flavobacteriia bacterium]|nr:tRNA (guanine-N1)-methyltransferase [Flavobacteriia bacterium]
MKLSKIFISFIFLLFTSLIAFSQNAGSAANEGSLNSGNIESQFDYLYKKSFKWTDPNTGQRYKTVKVNHLFKFKNNILDSLKSGRKKLLDIQKVVAAQKSEIEALKLELGTINKKLGSVTEEKDSIRFLGIPLSKASYNT